MMYQAKQEIRRRKCKIKVLNWCILYLLACTIKSVRSRQDKKWLEMEIRILRIKDFNSWAHLIYNVLIDLPEFHVFLNFTLWNSIFIFKFSIVKLSCIWIFNFLEVQVVLGEMCIETTILFTMSWIHPDLLKAICIWIGKE